MNATMRTMIGLALAAMPVPCAAQWNNLYPLVEGYSHHVYLEQENLPILSSGPINPAPSPDGRQIAFAHQGWIWLLDVDSGIARRLTDRGQVDGRPRWSPDGRQLAFVRDTGRDTSIVIRHLDDGSETVLDSPAIDLDPEFTRDGRSLYYASARGGKLSIWRHDFADGADTPVSEGTRARRAARSLPGGGLLFVSEEGGANSIRRLDPDGSEEQLIVTQGWMAHLDPSLHPSGRSMVYGVGDGNNLRLAVMDLARPDLPRWLTTVTGRAMQPAFSADGRSIFFVRTDEEKQFVLMQVNAAGGTPRPVPITSWDYGAQTGTVMLSVTGEDGSAIPARVSIRRADGHPVANPDAQTYFNNQAGEPYFYVPGQVELTLPAGDYRAVITQGPFSIPVEIPFAVTAGVNSERTASVRRIWDAAEAGFVSADLHDHLNASGLHELDLEDILPLMQGEDLDFTALMAWNQTNRFIDADRIGQRQIASDGTAAVLSQEVRSDFHGHVGMIGLAEPFHPWFFGPRNPTYVDQDVNNGDAIAFATARGALASYVHPVDGSSDPFDDLAANPIPLELVLDGVMTPGIGLEIVCQWTSALGTSEVWYRLLNIGRPIVATSGTDMMANFYRAPAIGTARSYLPSSTAAGFDAMVGEVRSGSGFVTTGPALLFAIDGSGPGEAISAGSHGWTVEVISVASVEAVEIVVNGQVVERLAGFEGPGRRTYSGRVDLPAGGWVAARSVGGTTDGPSMTVFPFAHSSPVWIGAVGSTDPEASRAAAADLLRALDYSERQFAENYADGIPAGLAARIAVTRQELERIVR